VESAEMSKHALNAYLAASVAFINEVAGICEQVGADAGDVEQSLKSDPRIGPRAYLRPGSAFAGGTLSRDLSFLVETGSRTGAPAHLLAAVEASNRAHLQWPHRRLVQELGELGNRCIGVLGLAYKPGTDTLRGSSAVETCRWLHQQGACPQAYDPAVQNLPPELGFIRLRPSVEEAAQGADALWIATAWPEFASLRADQLAKWMKQAIILDPGRVLAAGMRTDRRIRYLTVGKP